jgi:hypothetical protein
VVSCGVGRTLKPKEHAMQESSTAELGLVDLRTEVVLVEYEAHSGQLPEQTQ